jgi:hypothetical protein
MKYRDVKVEEIPPILISETRQAIKDLKQRKTAGEGGVTNECLKIVTDTLTDQLTRLFNDILTEEEIPQQ